MLLLFFKDGIATQQQSNYKDVDIICPYYNVLNKNIALENLDDSVFEIVISEER